MITAEESPVTALQPKAQLTGKVVKTTLAGALVDVGPRASRRAAHLTAAESSGQEG